MLPSSRLPAPCILAVREQNSKKEQGGVSPGTWFGGCSFSPLASRLRPSRVMFDRRANDDGHEVVPQKSSLTLSSFAAARRLGLCTYAMDVEMELECRILPQVAYGVGRRSTCSEPVPPHHGMHALTLAGGHMNALSQG